MNIKIIVATHKKYKMPKDDIFLPLHVGNQGKESIGFICDNTGENISVKNPFWCELTGLYWAWKNLKCDYLGLVHYRRHFKGKTKTNDKFERIISVFFNNFSNSFLFIILSNLSLVFVFPLKCLL